MLIRGDMYSRLAPGSEKKGAKKDILRATVVFKKECILYKNSVSIYGFFH